MGTTKNFKKTIQEYLEKRAIEDSLFAVQFSKKEKNINGRDVCRTWILYF